MVIQLFQTTLSHIACCQCSHDDPWEVLKHLRRDWQAEEGHLFHQQRIWTSKCYPSRHIWNSPIAKIWSPYSFILSPQKSRSGSQRLNSQKWNPSDLSHHPRLVSSGDRSCQERRIYRALSAGDQWSDPDISSHAPSYGYSMGRPWLHDRLSELFRDSAFC